MINKDRLINHGVGGVSVLKIGIYCDFFDIIGVKYLRKN